MHSGIESESDHVVLQYDEYCEESAIEYIIQSFICDNAPEENTQSRDHHQELGGFLWLYLFFRLTTIMFNWLDV